jgi:DNA repair protein RecO (recombination protein O)
MSATRRKSLEPAFLLHHRAWSDTSRILELFTRAHGRVTLFAHGARRERSPLRAVLRPFLPLLVSWSGRADGGTLTGAESAGAGFALAGDDFLSGFYLNELLIKLLPKEDRHEALFDAYATAIRDVAEGAGQAALRSFERILLDELGYGSDLSTDAGTGRPVEADRYYHFEPGKGVLAVREAGPADYSGRDVMAVARGQLDGAPALRAARAIYGAAIAHCLEGRALATRQVMLDMRRRERDG